MKKKTGFAGFSIWLIACLDLSGTAIGARAASAAPGDADRHAYRCNYAVVKASGSGYGRVRAAPHNKSKSVARLANDTPVYICDEVPGWDKVHFGAACRAVFAGGLDARKARADCKAGWMKDSDIRVVSG